MASQPVSFISEHSAEYVLVPNMARILSTQFEKVIPIYFWATREGNSMSKSCAENRSIYLLAMFPRRPKIFEPGASQIRVKFNSVLFSAALRAQEFGVPVFAGVPLTNSILNFDLETQCLWFVVNAIPGETADVEIDMSVDNPTTATGICDKKISGPLSADEILEHFYRLANRMTWDTAIEAMRTIRATQSFTMWPFLQAYKPMYFALA